MASGATIAFANRAKLYLDASPAGATTPTTELTICKDVEITVSAEHVPLYGWGSIIRQGVAKHSLKVAIKIGYMKWNPGTTAFPVTIFGATCTSGGAGDTNVVTQFALKGVFTFEDGQTLTATIQNIFFPDFSIKGSEGQWIKMDLSGEGSTIVFS